MLQGFTPQLRLEARHRIRKCTETMHLWFLYMRQYMMLSNVNQNSSMASVIIVQIYLWGHDNMEMNWGLERRAPQLRLATCNFPNPPTSGWSLFSNDVLMHLELCLIDRPHSEVTPSLLPLLCKCHANFLALCAAVIAFSEFHKRAGKTYLFIFFFYIFPYIEINLHWFSSELNTVCFLWVQSCFFFNYYYFSDYYLDYLFHFSDLEFA